MDDIESLKDTDIREIGPIVASADEVAALILIGLAANASVTSGYQPDEIAKRAYSIADAFIAEREFRGQGGTRKPVTPQLPATASTPGRSAGSRRF